MNTTCTQIAIGILFLALTSSLTLAQTTIGEGELKFEVKHRINAHGDEFNALAMSSDRQRLFTGTEKGDVIVWNVSTNRLERTLHQPSVIHLVAALSDPRELVAAGSYHVEGDADALHAGAGLSRAGTFVDLEGIDSDSNLTGLAVDNDAGLIAAVNQVGVVVVWDSRTNKQLAQWKVSGVPTGVALLGRNVYVATVSQKPELETTGDGAIVKLNLDDRNRPPAELSRVTGRLWLLARLVAGPPSADRHVSRRLQQLEDGCDRSRFQG